MARCSSGRPYCQTAQRESRVLIRRLKQAATLAAGLLKHRDITADIAGELWRRQFETAQCMARTVARKSDLGSEKVISRQYRYLWICNPKVASRSIITALRRADPDAEIIHSKSLSDIYALYPEARDYHRFAFIRHPFHRALSFYAEIHFFPERYQGAQRRHKREKQQGFFDQCYGLEEASSFDAYCQWLNTPYGADAFAERHYQSQHLQMRLDDGRLPDFIGRFENLDEDWHRITARLGLPAPELPVLNTMAGWQPLSPEALMAARADKRALLTARNRELLAIRYATDLELGGYSPDLTATANMEVRP